MKIPKGEKNGLPHFFELVSYYNNVKSKFIQIEFSEFCETPDGTRVLENTMPSIVISDKDDVVHPYSDYCAQFGDNAIQQAINDHLNIL